ncbi:MAG: DUF3108 domain-containing protein [Desulfovibrionales bacterium]
MTRTCAAARSVYIATFLLLALFGMQQTAFGASLPFSPGERLTYELRWAFISAGEIILEVRENGSFEGRQAHHFMATARSNSFVDKFYKVRDRIESFCEPDMSRALHYYKKEHEGNHQGEIWILFDWEEQTARHKNLKREKNPISIQPHTFDPLSIFYSFRFKDLAVGEQYQGTVTDGKKIVLGQAKVLSRQHLKVKAGTFDTFLVEPDTTEVGGVFKKSKDAKLHVWVTADEFKIPVKIKSKVVVGYFTAELVALEGVPVRPVSP